MNFLRNFIFLFSVCLSIFSCGDRFGEQHNDALKKSREPLVEPSSSKKSSNEEEHQNNTKTPVQKEIQKKKKIAVDTLKPVKV